VDWKDAAAPVLIWQGTEMRCRFSGKKLGLRFKDSWGQNCFNVIVDGEIFFIKITEQGENSFVLNKDLSDGPHELTLYKRTEAFSSHIAFLGLLTAPTAELGPKPEPRPLRLEFYGDSITAGACCEDPGTDQYEDASTHNHYRSYGAMTARNLGGEQVSVAVSGIGLCESWDPRVMGQIYDKLYVDPQGQAWDWSGRTADIVVINLGQNDFGFPSFHWRPFPADFQSRYVQFARAIRARYPQAEIVCALGGMRCYEESPELRAAFDGAVAELQAADKRIHRYIFKAFSNCHPRVDAHERMAAELTSFLIKTLYRRG
jgi:lysophospholipase L1-like esterase